MYLKYSPWTTVGFLVEVAGFEPATNCLVVFWLKLSSVLFSYRSYTIFVNQSTPVSIAFTNFATPPNARLFRAVTSLKHFESPATRITSQLLYLLIYSGFVEMAGIEPTLAQLMNRNSNCPTLTVKYYVLHDLRATMRHTSKFLEYLNSVTILL
ncbi:hypothetical protein MYP_691 [Sporocytophaga myxococcoides]|uniref:Uncharacterized protein n=1 Tax=Sporocytophaga myxococcoides TaxID=153721 RepID=A0A098LAJ5_9BACT|nr:hypothetical protein MYP_691 [Sporocytophaga myxococcoides]